MKSSRSSRFRTAAPAPGVTLIELMIALVLGMIVVGAAIALFVGNRQTYRATESLARVQENARTAFEMMSREIREAGAVPCSNESAVTNKLNTPTANWWSDWGAGIRGYAGNQAFAAAPAHAFGTGNGVRLSATDAIELKSGVPLNIVLTQDMATASAVLTVNSTADISVNDILVACDFGDGGLPKRGELSTIFQATSKTGTTILHAASGNPGNCSADLGPGCVATTTPGIKINGMVGRLRSTRWYIANNGRGNRSLYRSRLNYNAGAAPDVQNEEIVDGIQNMTLTYLRQGTTDYVAAGTVTDWSQVLAVKINLALQGADQVGVNGEVVARSLEHVVAIRNNTP
jgi:type IV pilus assembly protein PilW